MTSGSVLLALLALAAGIAIGSLAASLALGRAISRERVRATALEGAVSSLRSDNDVLRQRQGDSRSLDDLLTPVRDSLDSLRRATDSSSRDRTEAEATLTTQLTAVQERYQSLETSTKALASALARGQSRGQWGEMQLEGLLSHSGLIEGTHYRCQDTRVSTDGVSRPDVVVLMPGGGEVLIDAKFPFDAYWQALGTDDAPARDLLMRKHADDVRGGRRNCLPSATPTRLPALTSS